MGNDGCPCKPLSGDLRPWRRTDYPAAVRTGLQSLLSGTGCTYPEGSPEAQAWQYGRRWAETRAQGSTWKPAPWKGRPVPTREEAQAAAPKGKRPRVAYWIHGRQRIGIGYAGERFDSLAAEIARCYPEACIVGEPVGDSLLAQHLAGWMLAREAAKAKGMRKAAFLDMAKHVPAIERSIAHDDDLHRRMWVDAFPVVAQDFGDDTNPIEPARDANPCRRGVWKTERTGRLTTRGKPILRKIGEECWYGGSQMHRSPPINGVIQRWKESELLGMPIPGDWGTRSREPAT